MREVATESFHAKKKAAVDRRDQRQKSKHMQQLWKQVTLYKHVVNACVASPVIAKMEAQRKREEAEDMAEDEKPIRSGATAASSSVYGSQAAGSRGGTKAGKNEKANTSLASNIPDLGSEEYKKRLTDLYELRDRLASKKAPKKKGKKRGGKGGNDDALSVYSVAISQKTGGGSDEEEIINKYGIPNFMDKQGKPRSYSCTMHPPATLSRLGIENFDRCQN